MYVVWCVSVDVCGVCVCVDDVVHVVWYVSVCLQYVCTHMSVPVCVHMFPGACACGGLRLTSGFFLDYSLLDFGDRVSVNQERIKFG